MSPSNPASRRDELSRAGYPVISLTRRLTLCPALLLSARKQQSVPSPVDDSAVADALSFVVTVSPLDCAGTRVAASPLETRIGLHPWISTCRPESLLRPHRPTRHSDLNPATHYSIAHNDIPASLCGVELASI